MSLKIYLDGHPISSAKHFDFNTRTKDLMFKNTKKNIEGGFIGPLLTSLIPLGIDLFSKLISRGNGLYGGSIFDNKEMNKKYNCIVTDSNDKILKKFKTNSYGGALIIDPSFLKKLIANRLHIEKGDGMYSSKGISSGGKIGNNLLINN